MSKIQQIDCVVVNENKSVYFRSSTLSYKNGYLIDCETNQMVVNPGDDYSGQPDEVRQVCMIEHTPEVVEAFQNAKVMTYADTPSYTQPSHLA